MSSLPDYCSEEYLHIKSTKSLNKSEKQKKNSKNPTGKSTDVDQGVDVKRVAESIPVSTGLSSSLKNNSVENENKSIRSGQKSTSKDNMYNIQRLNSLKINYQKKQVKEPFVIGVCGGSASGKTTVCCKIVESLKNKRVVVLSQDSFYKVLSPDEKKLAANSEYDFDHPDSFDYKLLESTMKKLKKGKSVSIPIYDFKTHSRLEESSAMIMNADVIILEGILIFFTKSLRDIMDMKIFVDTDADVRLVRRIRRDIVERGRDLSGILIQYEKFVKPSFDDYIMPTKKYADIIIPRGGANMVAIDLLVQHVHSKLMQFDREFVSQLS